MTKRLERFVPIMRPYPPDGHSEEPAKTADNTAGPERLAPETPAYPWGDGEDTVNPGTHAGGIEGEGRVTVVVSPELETLPLSAAGAREKGNPFTTRRGTESGGRDDGRFPRLE